MLAGPFLRRIDLAILLGWWENCVMAIDVGIDTGKKGVVGGR